MCKYTYQQKKCVQSLWCYLKVFESFPTVNKENKLGWGCTWKTRIKILRIKLYFEDVSIPFCAHDSLEIMDMPDVTYLDQDTMHTVKTIPKYRNNTMNLIFLFFQKLWLQRFLHNGKLQIGKAARRCEDNYI